MKRALVLHEVGHVQALEQDLASLQREGDVVVIALGADIEYLLEERGIAFISGREFRKVPPIERLTVSERLSWGLCTDPHLSFFSHNGISLSKIHHVALQDYLSIALYYIDIFGQILRSQYGITHIIIPRSERTVPETSGLLAPLEVRVIEDVAKFVCTHYGTTLHVLPARSSNGSSSTVSRYSFTLKRFAFSIFLSMVNTIVSLVEQPKRIRLLVTDYWKNIAPYLAELPETEVILLDRSEALHAGRTNIFKHRMRFMHSSAFSSRSTRSVAKQAAAEYVAEWKKIRDDFPLLQQAQFSGYDIGELIRTAFDHIIQAGGELTTMDIEDAYAMMRSCKPSLVMVRASVSAQRHFSILCYVAKSLNIPSLEVQHGLLYLGPGSYANHPSAEYIAEYGPLARKGLRALGYSDTQLFDIGSPRFDQYGDSPKYEPSANQDMRMLCIVPGVTTGLWVDTYEVIDFCAGIAVAMDSAPNVKVTLKLRPGPAYQDFYEETFRRVFGARTIVVAQKESLRDLFAQTDVVLSCYSTALLEGMVVAKPTIYSGTLSMHAALGIEIEEYEENGALLFAHTDEELVAHVSSLSRDESLREKLSKSAAAFMNTQYSFRGDAAKRLADTIRTIAHAS